MIIAPLDMKHLFTNCPNMSSHAIIFCHFNAYLCVFKIGSDVQSATSPLFPILMQACIAAYVCHVSQHLPFSLPLFKRGGGRWQEAGWIR